jgi:7-carboxy-7-deazaguanine synthase
MSLDEIVKEVDKHPTRYVVLTGGEPMVAKGIRDLASRLHDMGKHITIETAATVAPEGIACDLASLSPKLSNSTPEAGTIEQAWIERHEERRLRPDIIRDWIGTYHHQLKFVITNDSQLTEIEDLLSLVGESVTPERVQLMPEGRTVDELRHKATSLLDLCKRKGYRYCNRLHIELFGNTRGT